VSGVAVFASCAWLSLLATALLGTLPWRPPAGRRSLALRGERPAVVSLLAGRLSSDGYPATLLDLAARGWFAITEAEPGRVTCRIADRAQDGDLAEYERRVLSHLVFRAGGLGSVPGAALGSGFELGDQEFHELFEAEVLADAVGLGLVRRRLSLGIVVPLVLAGLPVAALALAAEHRHGLVLPAVGTLLGVPVIMGAFATLGGRIKRTPAGNTALAEWLGFRVALTGSRSRRATAPALLAGNGDAAIGYAAALGAAPAAVAAFAAAGQLLWSSYGGGWHQVSIGRPGDTDEPDESRLPGPVAVGLVLLGLLILALLVAAMFSGLGLVAPLVVPLVAIPVCSWLFFLRRGFRSSARAERLPPIAEFDGQIVKKWTAEVRDEESSETYYYLAIDDGERERAWVLCTDRRDYSGSRAGMVVRVRADRRRNRVIAVSPAPDTSPRARPVTPGCIPG
jgi:hypothetical protein